MAIASDYGRHPLDLHLEEVMPEGPGEGHYRRRAILDLTSETPKEKPGVRADDEFALPTRSSLIKHLKALIDAALARGGALNSDDDDPDLVALCERAGLTLSEYEAVTMRSNGLKWSEIGEAQGVSRWAAARAAARGFEKVRKFILSC